jgi:hypothetical protein
LKKRAQRRNRGSTTSCAAAFGIWSTIYKTSPPAAVPNASAA